MAFAFVVPGVASYDAGRMFRFVYTLRPNETIDPAAIDGLVGVELAGDDATTVADGLKVVGRRAEQVGRGNLTTTHSAVPEGGYVVVPAGELAPAAFGSELGRLADVLSGVDGSIFVENGGAYRNSPELWRLLEMAHHPRVKIALDLDRAQADGSVPSRVIPTLNLRIGLVRVRANLPDLANYAKRLAGIGFDGYVVLDPPSGDDRFAKAAEFAAVFRGIFPAKPVKKTAPAKVAGA